VSDLEQFNKDFEFMPTNLYGTHDNFDLNSSHVRHDDVNFEAKLNDNAAVVPWGTGTPMREFLCR
jgi:GDP-L-fucose synthase